MVIILTILIYIYICVYSDFGKAQKAEQDDPCKSKARVVGDITHCDRYWECQNNQAELYDCPNGLVFAGKHRGVTEGCDYPWRSNYCEAKQLASKRLTYNNLILFFHINIRTFMLL